MNTIEASRRESGGKGGGSAKLKQSTVSDKAKITLARKDSEQRNSGQSAGYVLLSFTCALCAFLSIICFCLTFALVLLGQRVDATEICNGTEISFMMKFPKSGLKWISSQLVGRHQSFISKSHGTRKLNDYSLSNRLNRDMTAEANFRLPKEIRPLYYDLYLHPDLNNGTFEGRVSILIEISKKYNFITLHQKDLSIKVLDLAMREREDQLKVKIKESYPLNKNETFMIIPTEELEVGVYNLTLSFTGSLQDKIVGFYSSKYIDEKMKTRVIATSKFEPTYARRAFPCFDEPSFKAQFDVKLVHPTGDCYSALSNMNVEKSEANKPSEGFTTVTFAKSVPMSTYLACFIISDFVAVSKKANGLDGKTFPVSVYTTKAQKEKGSFALDIGVKIIEFYINLFKLDYPLPKMDMAAIPDFVSGAMENWGLVTYREARLLYDNETSTSNQEDIVLVIAHEFAHMWFGNLVTMAWWNDLWLNEGFATFMQFKSSNTILPEWHFMDQFLLRELHVAMATDAKLSSHPIVQKVTNPDEITAIFDVISYQKGASILRMLENFVGTEVFYEGVTKYLKKFAYGNAETADLLNMIQTSLGSQINVNAIMDTWTRQMGFPVLNVYKNKFTYTLKQKRFLSNPDSKYDPSESIFGYKWSVPVTYITSENSTPTLIWFDKDTDTLEIKLNEPVEWIKFNADQIGYYRVNYEQPEWQSLLNVLGSSHKRFSTQDRTHLLEDAFSLAAAKELDYATAMNMTLYLGSEKHFSPWEVAANKLRAVDKLLSSTPASSKFREYVRELVDGTYHDVTWNVDKLDDHDMLNLRNTILGLACSVGHVECLEEAGAIFRAWINDEKDVRPHPDIREHVYYYGMSHVGDETEWDVMFKRFSKEKSAAEKSLLMKGLAGIRSSWILKKYITLAMDEKLVRSQDALNCLIYISNNPEGTNLVWDWVRENWEFLVKRYSLNDRYLGQLIPAITKSFTSQVKLNEIREFFERNPEAGAGATARAQALETVETNVKWLENHMNKIDQWLDSRPTPRHIS